MGDRRHLPRVSRVPPGSSPCRRWCHLLEVRHSPNRSACTYGAELRRQGPARPAGLVWANSTPPPAKPAVTPLSWSSPALLTGRRQALSFRARLGVRASRHRRHARTAHGCPLSVPPSQWRMAAGLGAGLDSGSGSDSPAGVPAPARGPRAGTWPMPPEAVPAVAARRIYMVPSQHRDQQNSAAMAVEGDDLGPQPRPAQPRRGAAPC